MPYTDLEDVALYVDELRGDDVPEDLEDKTERLIEEAEDMLDDVATRAGSSLEARLAAQTVRLRAVVRVVAEMVAGVLQNPGCYISSSESVGGVSQSRTLDLKTATGRLRLSDEQRQQLGLPRAAGGKGGGKAFTINPSSSAGPRVLDTSWAG